jgi:hypothetical protein
MKFMVRVAVMAASPVSMETRCRAAGFSRLCVDAHPVQRGRISIVTDRPVFGSRIVIEGTLLTHI